METKIVCSMKDAAQSLGVCPNTLYKHIREGRLESTKLGSRRLIKVESLHRLVGADLVAA